MVTKVLYDIVLLDLEQENATTVPSSLDEPLSLLPETRFHNSCITEIRASNNGHPFTETDWKRVTVIAEGNTDVDSIGRFGVGFFSVFSISEKPTITSGNQSMKYIWEGDSLTTSVKILPIKQQSETTLIKLKAQKKYILLTNPREIQRTISEPVLTLKLIELKTYFAKGIKTNHLAFFLLLFLF